MFNLVRASTVRTLRRSGSDPMVHDLTPQDHRSKGTMAFRVCYLDQLYIPVSF